MKTIIISAITAIVTWGLIYIALNYGPLQALAYWRKV